MRCPYLSFYYRVKSFLPRRVIVFLRRQWIGRKRKKYRHVWPVLPETGKPPKNWCGWPDNKTFCLVLTHDVDTAIGQARVRQVMDLESAHGFKSAFYVVPERFDVDDALLQAIGNRGFELGVHGVNHDGNLFKNKAEFKQRAERINHWLKAWNAVGFRAPAMHHNYEWMHDLNMAYDASSGDFDPFEPQPLSFGSLWPAILQNPCTGREFVEIPYTLPMDFSTFVLMKEKTLDLWKKKVDFIARSGGVAHLITHPDYMAFDGQPTYNEYSADLYESMLIWLKEEYGEGFCTMLPVELAAYWKKNMDNRLTTDCEAAWNQ